jgi:hypothetical protein
MKNRMPAVFVLRKQENKEADTWIYRMPFRFHFYQKPYLVDRLP